MLAHDSGWNDHLIEPPPATARDTQPSARYNPTTRQNDSIQLQLASRIVPAFRSTDRRPLDREASQRQLVPPQRSGPLDVTGSRSDRRRAREHLPPLFDRTPDQLLEQLSARAHDQLLRRQLGGIGSGQQRRHRCPLPVLATPQRDRNPVVGRQIRGKLEPRLATAAVTDDPAVIGRRAHPAPHLRPHLNQFALVIAPGDAHHREELRLLAPGNPRQDLERGRLDQTILELLVLGRHPIPQLIEPEQRRPAAMAHEYGLLRRKA